MSGMRRDLRADMSQTKIFPKSKYSRVYLYPCLKIWRRLRPLKSTELSAEDVRWSMNVEINWSPQSIGAIL